MKSILNSSKRGRRVIVTVLVSLPCIYLSISFLAAFVLSTPHRTLSNQTPASVGLAFDDARFLSRARDVQIAAWYIPDPGSRKAVILVPGKDSSRTSEFANRFLEFARALHDRHFNILMIDLRGHGASGSAHITFGIKEKYDVEAAVDYLESKGLSPRSIGVLGVSLGASTSIFAAADDPDITAVVADSAYSDLYPVLEKNWRGVSGLPGFFLPGVRFAGRILFGYDVAKVRPVDSIRRIAPRSVLLIHGANDSLIPVWEAYEMKQAYPQSELWVVPGVEHAGAYMADPAEYVNRVADFFNRSLH